LIHNDIIDVYFVLGQLLHKALGFIEREELWDAHAHKRRHGLSDEKLKNKKKKKKKRKEEKAIMIPDSGIVG
jgi:hypothetical protein